MSTCTRRHWYKTHLRKHNLSFFTLWILWVLNKLRVKQRPSLLTAEATRKRWRLWSSSFGGDRLNEWLQKESLMLWCNQTWSASVFNFIWFIRLWMWTCYFLKALVFVTPSDVWLAAVALPSDNKTHRGLTPVVVLFYNSTFFTFTLHCWFSTSGWSDFPPPSSSVWVQQTNLRGAGGLMLLLLDRVVFISCLCVRLSQSAADWSVIFAADRHQIITHLLGPTLCRQANNRAWTFPFWRVHLYLHVVHEDLSCHAHLQHPMHYQLAEGGQQVPPPVEVLQPLHLQGFAHWGRTDGVEERGWMWSGREKEREGEEKQGGEVRGVINHEKSYNRKKRTKRRRKREFYLVSGQWL